MKKILVVEDDKEISSLIREYLTENGYTTEYAENGLDAVRIIRDDNTLSLVLLDMMLPYQSGDMVLKKVREFSNIPIIVVSAKSMVQSKIDAIRIGADDYITKPFDLDELLVRVEAVLRRCEGSAAAEQQCLTFKKLTLDRSSGTAAVDGKPLVLTGREYDILELLLKNPNKLFSRSNIYESIWNEPYLNEDTTIKVHMSNIRSKLKKLDDTEEYIETVWGMGYKLSN